MTTTSPSPRCAGALAGLKVIDLSRVLAGPMCSMILADHGADVVKVEPPQGDDTRRWGPPFQPEEGRQGDASYYLGLNRNKRAMALDLARPESRELLMTLLEGADVLIENFKTGTMEAWGLSYEEVLARRFPKLVYCRISGFGADGPLGGLPGYDAVLQAMSGLMSINGDAGTGPLRIGTPIVDLATGLYATIGILMALQERARSGRGQFIDATLYDCGLSLLHPHAANFFLSGRNPSPLGNTHPNVVPCDKFKTLDGEVFVVVGNEGQFRKLVQLLGRPELASDPRFATNRSRSEHRGELTAILTSLFADKQAEAVAVELLSAGVPIGPVMQLDASLGAAHTAHRGMVFESGRFKSLGTPVKLSRTPGSLQRKPPAFAEHSEEILRQHGVSEEAIEALRRSGALPDTMR